VRIVGAAKYAALQDRLNLEREEAEKRDAGRLATIERIRAERDQLRDAKPNTPLQQPQPVRGDAELQRRLNLALRAVSELQQRLDELQASNDAASRELQDLRRGVAS
jgi:chromosome segregation ATPase